MTKFYLQIADKKLMATVFSVALWSKCLGRFAKLTWWLETHALVEKIERLQKSLLPHNYCHCMVHCVFKTYLKVININKLMLLKIFWKVINCILLFHLIFQCHKIIFRETSYTAVFGKFSVLIFVNILLKKTAHAQLGYHTRKSWKTW